MPVLLFFIVFMKLDQIEHPKEVDVIIVPEGPTIRAYQAIDLLLGGYSRSNQLIVSSATEHNVPSYLDAGAESEPLISEEHSTSTWMNATNSIDIMEANNWDSALVVTTDYHTRRTHLSFERVSFEKDMDFTYVGMFYEEDDGGEPIAYLDHKPGRMTGLREMAKYFGYLLACIMWLIWVSTSFEIKGYKRREKEILRHMREFRKLTKHSNDCRMGL